MRNLIANWRTTATGLTIIIGAGVHLVFAIKAKTADENTWTTSLIAILTGAGFLVAGDSAASVTKQEANTQFIKKDDAQPKP